MSAKKTIITKLPAVEPGQHRRYTDEQRIEILRLLQENGYKYNKTSLQTGAPAATIKAWYSRYKGELSSMTSISCIAERVEMNVAQVKTDFISSHFSAIDALARDAITKASDLIKKETDLTKVNGTIKIITDFISKLSENGDNVNSSDTINIIQQTINNLNESSK